LGWTVWERLLWRGTAAPPAGACPTARLTRLLELYHNDGWACVMYEAYGRCRKAVFHVQTTIGSSRCCPSYTSPARTTTDQQEKTCLQQEAEGGLGREEA
jgi:hypothetical protein